MLAGSVARLLLATLRVLAGFVSVALVRPGDVRVRRVSVMVVSVVVVSAACVWVGSLLER